MLKFPRRRVTPQLSRRIKMEGAGRRRTRVDQRAQRGVCEREGEGGRERGRKGEIIIPKLRTAFVFIWHDWLHVVLAAVGERERRTERERDRRDTEI